MTKKRKFKNKNEEIKYLNRSISMHRHYRWKGIRSGGSKFSRIFADEVPGLREILKTKDGHNGIMHIGKAKKQHQTIKEKRARLRELQRQERRNQPPSYRINQSLQSYRRYWKRLRKKLP